MRTSRTTRAEEAKKHTTTSCYKLKCVAMFFLLVVYKILCEMYTIYCRWWCPMMRTMNIIMMDVADVVDCDCRASKSENHVGVGMMMICAMDAPPKMVDTREGKKHHAKCYGCWPLADGMSRDVVGDVREVFGWLHVSKRNCVWCMFYVCTFI